MGDRGSYRGRGRGGNRRRSRSRDNNFRGRGGYRGGGRRRSVSNDRGRSSSADPLQAVNAAKKLVNNYVSTAKGIERSEEEKQKAYYDAQRKLNIAAEQEKAKKNQIGYPLFTLIGKMDTAEQLAKSVKTMTLLPVTDANGKISTKVSFVGTIDTTVVFSDFQYNKVVNLKEQDDYIIDKPLIGRELLASQQLFKVDEKTNPLQTTANNLTTTYGEAVNVVKAPSGLTSIMLFADDAENTYIADFKVKDLETVKGKKKGEV